MIDYRKYNVWQKSHQLVLKVYSLTKVFPKSEQFNLISQINRAVLSIPTNIAEGCGRETQKELIRFLYISSGSTHELEYLIFVSKELNYINEEEFVFVQAEIESIKRMLASLINKIKLSIK